MFDMLPHVYGRKFHVVNLLWKNSNFNKDHLEKGDEKGVGLAHFVFSTCVSLNKNLSKYGVFLSLSFQPSLGGFWKPVAQYVPRKPSEMRILNPYFIQEAAFQFIGLPVNNGLMGKGVSANLIVISGRA